MRDIDDIKRTYAASAQVHGAATKEGEYERANAAHDVVLDAYRKLRAAGDEGIRALQELMEHHNDSVRCWAATHCLPTAQAKAEAVLMDLAEGMGAIAFTAEIVLEEWHKGTLEVPK